ncbi:hypothetical protein BOTBODRAFT_33093 [Botryobasidium botryosum FD-172 SS1]|uniref:Uncharacterized protein n=1 Tax=Botryobasidium botryosum (strain FD-172 SS1) TaxID=930990 RepID=A0A067MGZ1_BOTB1|nr:hypothetical protein BOTBODRAFT_33093 [Botryobasidium botryosum FD-172 SS1]
MKSDLPLEKGADEPSSVRLSSETTPAFIFHASTGDTSAISRQNQALPIYRLPNEIISYIFELANETDPDSISPHPLRLYTRWSISHVSRLWRQVALHMPRLWSIIVSTDCHVVEVCVIRSKDAPLDISLPNYDPSARRSMLFPSPHVARFKSCMEILAPHIGRWQSLEFGDVSIEEFMPYLDAAAPQLETLALSLSDYDPDQDLLLGDVLLPGNFPRVRELFLINAHIPLASPIYAGLTYLRLHDINFDTSSMDDLHSAINACPNLESLDLDRVIVRLPSSLSPSNPALSLELPKLSSLGLIDLQTFVTRDILASIRPSPSLELSTFNSLEGNDNLCNILPVGTHLSRTMPSLSRIKHLTFLFGVEHDGVASFDLSGREDMGPNIMDFSCISPNPGFLASSLFQVIGQQLDLSHLISLTLIGLTNALFSVDSFTNMLKHLPTIHRLEFKHCSTSFIEILCVTPTRSVCPMLSTLSIERSNISGPCLEALVQSRVSTNDEEDDSGRKNKLVEVHSRGCNRIDVEAWVRIQGLLALYDFEQTARDEFDPYSNFIYVLD